MRGRPRARHQSMPNLLSTGLALSEARKSMKALTSASVRAPFTGRATMCTTALSSRMNAWPPMPAGSRLEHGEVDEAGVHVARRDVGVDLRHGAHDLKLRRDSDLEPARLEPASGGESVDGRLRIGRGDGLHGVERDVRRLFELEPLAPDEHERRAAQGRGRGREFGLELFEAGLVGDDDVDAAAVPHLREHLSDVAAEALFHDGARLLLIELDERVNHFDVARARRDDDLSGGDGARG